MAEYVERESLKNNLHSTKEGIFYHDGKAYMDLNIVDKIVLDTPVADVVEVKHGHWQWETKIEAQAQNRLYCSVCGNECLGKDNYYVKTEYCPHCFARMDGTPTERDGECDG